MPPRARLLFFGYRLGMQRRELYATPYNELSDLMALEAIYRGVAKEKSKPRGMSLHEAIGIE